MRLYTFTNMYLSSIQNGIQSAHVLGELFVKYPYTPDPEKILGQPCEYLYRWASNYKTMIVLNGGYSSVLRELVDFFSQEEHPYPWAAFNEAEDALDNALTCVGIVLPERIYGFDYSSHTAMTTLPDYDPALKQWYDFTLWERDLITKLQDFSLAR